MRTFTVIWHYLGNHGSVRVEAYTREAAMRHVIRGFSDDFAKKAALLAIEGVHIFRTASGLAQIEVLATKGDQAIIGEGGAENTAIVDQDIVTDEDPTVWVIIGDIRTRIETSSVSEYLPADGPGCSAGGGR